MIKTLRKKKQKRKSNRDTSDNIEPKAIKATFVVAA